jgi:phenylacetate-CoA ligase
MDCFDCPVADEYGLVEAGIVAHTCPEGSLHLMDEILYVEVVDESGAPTCGVGEIVCTQLRNPGAPLIRYRTGDVGQLSTRNCPCGRGLRVLESLEGRVLDLLVLPEGGYASPHLVAQVLESFPTIGRMQIVQHDLDTLEIAVVADEELGPSQEGFLCQEIRKRFGEGFGIQVRRVSHIPTEGSGKYRWVKSRIYEKTQLPRPLTLTGFHSLEGGSAQRT